MFDLEGIAFDHNLDLDEGLEVFHAEMDRLRSEALPPPPFLDPVVWARANIDITFGFRKGKMRMTGFQRPVALAALDPATDQITVLKGVQVGWSTFMKTMLFYGVSYLAVSAIVTQPTDSDAQGYYNDQIEPHFAEDFFVGLRRSPKRGEAADTWNEHRFRNGGRLYMRGAASDDAFRRISAEWQMADEADADGWKSSGTARSQGDKLALYRDRGTAHAHPVMWVGSTPLERETSLVYREWLQSTQERLHVACPHCGTRQYLKWGSDKNKTPYGFRWTTNDKGHVTDCHYVCEGSRACVIGEEHKEDMVEGGEFVAMNATPNRPGHCGFHWPAWHSMAPQAGWRNLATQWLAAQQAKADGNVDLLKRFINNVMAEPWDNLEATSLDTQTVHDMQRPYSAEIPDDVLFLTAGIDTQSNKEGSDLEQIASREITITGWNSRMMPRVIGHWVVHGEPGDRRADDELRVLIRRRFRRADGVMKRVEAAAHDLGGHYGDQVKQFCRSFPSGECVWAIKGKNVLKGRRDALVFPRKPSRGGRGGVPYYSIDTGLAKDAVGRMLRVSGPGGPVFPMSLQPGYFDRLMCEEPRKQKNGGFWWTPKRGHRSSEEWDCLVYSYVAACGLRSKFKRFVDLNLAARKDGIADEPHDPETGELTEDLPYDGDDKSAQAASVATVDQAPRRGSRPRTNAEPQSRPEASTETPDTGGAKRRRVKARGGKIGVSRFGRTGEGW